MTDEPSSVEEAEKMLESIQKKSESTSGSAAPVYSDVEQKQETHMAILHDPSMFDCIVAESDKKVVGERESRKVILLCSCGRLVENCQIASYNLLVNSESGAGKDWIASKTLELLPPADFVFRTRITPTALTYWHDAESEPEWTWNGKTLYLEDVGDGVLNSEVFKVMCSSGSRATITVKQRAVDIEVRGKPVIITTTASATPSPELIRRFAILQLDESMEQTREIMKNDSIAATKGRTLEYNPDIISAQALLRRVKVKIPFAADIDPHFPADNIIMRTNYPRFLDFIKASAALHQHQRELDGEGFVLATGMDYDIARACFLKLFSNPYMIPLTRNQNQIVAYFVANPSLLVSVSELYNVQKLNFITDRALETNLKTLLKYRILTTTVEKDGLNRDITKYSIKRAYTAREGLHLPTFAEIAGNNAGLGAFLPSATSGSSVSPASKPDVEVIEASEEQKSGSVAAPDPMEVGGFEIPLEQWPRGTEKTDKELENMFDLDDLKSLKTYGRIHEVTPGRWEKV